MKNSFQIWPSITKVRPPLHYKNQLNESSLKKKQFRTVSKTGEKISKNKI